MNRHPARPIDPEDTEAFDRDGVVALRQMFDSDWIALLQEGLAAVAELLAAGGEPTGFEGAGGGILLYRQVQQLGRFVTDSPAAEIAGTLMGAEAARLLCDRSFGREPGDCGDPAWHADLAYWPMDGAQACSLWVALDHVDGEHGTVQYICGSQRWDVRPDGAADGGHAAFRREDYEIVSYALEPGDCMVHHARVLHAAGPVLRHPGTRGYATQWCGDDIRARHPADEERFPVIWRRSG